MVWVAVGPYITVWVATGPYIMVRVAMGPYIMVWVAMGPYIMGPYKRNNTFFTYKGMSLYAR